MDVHRKLAEMALELEHERTPEQMLEKVSGYACSVLSADDAGIMLVKSRKRVETPSATSSRVDQAHQLQAEFDEGACLDAIDGKATYVSGHLETDERWPMWGPAAARIGYQSVVGVRLASRGRGYGSLNVYAERRDAFGDEEAEICEMLAAHATAAFAFAEREQGLTTALETRTVIGQAQGILMQKFDIDADAAFKFLKRISQNENQRLLEVAGAIAVQRDANARPAALGTPPTMKESRP